MRPTSLALCLAGRAQQRPLACESSRAWWQWQSRRHQYLSSLAVLGVKGTVCGWLQAAAATCNPMIGCMYTRNDHNQHAGFGAGLKFAGCMGVVCVGTQAVQGVAPEAESHKNMVFKNLL